MEAWNLYHTIFDVLVIGETKLNDSFASSQFYIPGYKFYRKDRPSNKNGGGLVIYVRSNLTVQRHENLECSNVESIMLKIKLGSSDIALLGVYRPPNTKKSVWTSELQTLLENASNLAKDTVLLGDLNCDLLRPDIQGKEGRTLLDICDLYDLQCLINGPTRITNNTATLIDVILVNNRKRFLHADVLEPHLSDHNLVCAAMKLHLPKARPKFIAYRKIKDLDCDKLKKDLELVPFHASFIFDEIDDIYWAWQKLYTDVINDHAPLKKVKVKGNQVPYMNKELRTGIRKRKHLWKKYKNSDAQEDYNKYKQQRNLTVKLRRKAIASYFRNKTENANSRPGEFWKTFKPFLHTKGSKSCNDIAS